MVLILALALPAVAGLALLAVGRRLPASVVRVVAALTTTATLALVGFAAASRPEVDRPWVPELGVRLHFGVDGISAPLLVLTAAVCVLVAAHAWVEIPVGGAPSTFLGAVLLVEAGALATFAARDAILFFVAFEVVLVPMWVLITRFGDPRDDSARVGAGQRFILYTAVGSTLMLVGILLLVDAAGTGDLVRIAAGDARPIGTDRQVLVAALLVLGLGVKVPVFPLHTWLPPAHTTAPTAGSVLLAAVLLKMGSYGLVRLPIASVPEGFSALAPVLAVAGAVGIVWGGLVCLVEQDLKRLIAYSSVAHMGFVVLGLASGTRTGMQAALFANVAHGVIAALLFVVVGGLKARWGGVRLDSPLPPLREVAPRMGFFLVLGLAAALGLPGLAAFWGEILALYAAWSPADPAHLAVLRACAVVGALGAALATGYTLRVARRVWMGDAVAAPDPEAPGPASPATPDARGSELVVLATLSTAVVVLGVLPGPLLSVTSGAVDALLGGVR